MLTFAVESYRKVVHELKELYPRHWEELALDKDEIALDPDYERYMSFDLAGMIHLFTARDGRKLVGYFIFIVLPSLHYKKSLQAYYDIFYLLPEYRKGWNGIRFVRFAESSLKKAGVQKMYVGVKLNHDFGKVFEYLNFQPAERIYTKLIG